MAKRVVNSDSSGKKPMRGSGLGTNGQRGREIWKTTDNLGRSQPPPRSDEKAWILGSGYRNYVGVTPLPAPTRKDRGQNYPLLTPTNKGY